MAPTRQLALRLIQPQATQPLLGSGSGQLVPARMKTLGAEVGQCRQARCGPWGMQLAAYQAFNSLHVYTAAWEQLGRLQQQLQACFRGQLVGHAACRSGHLKAPYLIERGVGAGCNIQHQHLGPRGGQVAVLAACGNQQAAGGIDKGGVALDFELHAPRQCIEQLGVPLVHVCGMLAAIVANAAINGNRQVGAGHGEPTW